MLACTVPAAAVIMITWPTQRSIVEPVRFAAVGITEGVRERVDRGDGVAARPAIDVRTTFAMSVTFSLSCLGTLTNRNGLRPRCVPAGLATLRRTCCMTTFADSVQP